MRSIDKLLKLLGRSDYVPINARGLASRLRISPTQFDAFEQLLHRLETEGRIVRVRHNRYALPKEADLVAGRLMVNRSGGAILQPEEPGGERLFIPEHATGTAFLNDRVLVRRSDPDGRGDREPSAIPRGKVIRVLERARTEIVGTLHKTSQFHYIIPDDPRIPHDIYVTPPGRRLRRAPKPGDKVVVRLVEWVSRHNNPEGCIVSVLGPPDQSGVDIESVMRQYQLPTRFPQKVLQESRQIQNRRQTRQPNRRDCRRDCIVTIDPKDAKDFDDAISVERQANGHFKLWVHIADVSHYVKPGSELDREAQERGNSTYLVDRVIPMLPESLSNDLCSLVPRQDRLTKCAELLVTKEGRVLESRFYPAVIRSQRRFTYEEVQKLLLRKPEDRIERMLHEASRLAQRIRRKRMRSGSLNLDLPEHKVVLDERGAVQRVERREYDASHQLIEEFMLLANEAVARELGQRRTAAIYRIHEPPQPDRLDELRGTMRRLGIACGDLNRKGALCRLVSRIRKHPAANVLTIAVLRSLQRARYAVEPLGHFGLGKEDYTHFTSPIRRYADLVVHRVLFKDGKQAKSDLQQTAEHISFTERQSSDAETDSRTVKLHAMLREELENDRRRVYHGVVTEIRNFAVFLEIEELGLSGAIRVSSLDDDFYQYQPQRMQLRGRRHHRTISMGDRLEVRVTKVDPLKKLVNFEPAHAARKPTKADKTGRQTRRPSSTKRGRGRRPRR